MRNHLQSSAAFYINVYLADRVYFMYNSGCDFRFCIFLRKQPFLQNWRIRVTKRMGGVRKYINICYLLSPLRQPHAHSAASYQTFSKAEQAPPLFRIELFSVNRPCKLHILYHTFDIICAYRISLCNLCFSIFIVLNNFFN